MTWNRSWGVDYFSEGAVRVVLFVSRNKDNRLVEGFKERRTSFITDRGKDDPRLLKKFQNFVEEGLDGEVSRMYMSVNPRDMQAIRVKLMHFLFDNDGFNLCSIQSKLAGIAADKECAAGKRWLIDFDTTDEEKLEEFINDLSEIIPRESISKQRTPNGYAIITDRGFDSRELMHKWSDVMTIKKDDLLCVTWGTSSLEATCIDML